MALEKQNWQHPLTSGIDTLTDEKALKPPTLSRLENAVLTTPGVLKKRKGFAALNAADTNGVPTNEFLALAKFQDELLGFNGTDLYSYATGSTAWANKGTCRSVGVSASFITTGGTPVTETAVTDTATQRVYCYVRDGVVYSTVLDLVTEAPIISDVFIHAGTSAQVCVVSGVAYLLYLDTGFVWLAAWDGNAWGTRKAIVAADIFNVSDDDVYLGGWVAFAYAIGSTTRACALEVATADASTVQFTDTTITPTSLAIRAFTTLIDDENPSISPSNTLVVYMANSNGTTINLTMGALSASSNVATVIGTNVTHLTLVVKEPTDVAVLVEEANSGNPYLVKHTFRPNVTQSVGSVIVTDVAGGTAPAAVSTTLKRNMALAAQAFKSSNKWYLPCFSPSASGLQDTFYLLDSANGDVVAKACYTQAKACAAAVLPYCATPTDFFVMPARLQGRVNEVAFNADVVTFSNTVGGVVTWDFTVDFQFATAELGRNLHIAGGFLQTYDGRSLFEHGFFVFPEGIVGVPAGAGSGLTAGTYQYKVLYEWTDGQGQLHRSATSPTETVVVTDGQEVAFSLPTLRITNRVATSISIVVYRTEVNGTVFYRLGTPATATMNDATVDSVVFLDAASDTVLTTHELLYINGGELDNDSPPPCLSLISAKNRLWAVDEFGDLWFSKEYFTGEAVGWSLGLKKTVPRDGGEITALGHIDDKIIVFKANKSFYFAGGGPLPTGQQDTFTDVGELPFKLGCSNPNSLVEYDEGLFFESNRGIWLLDRGLQAIALGNKLKAYDDYTITGAVHRTDVDQVWFATEEGPVLVFDYTMPKAGQPGSPGEPGQWSIHTGLAANDITILENRIILARVDGAVWQESLTLFTDNGNYYSMLLETSWIALAGMAGWKRVYAMEVLGELRSAHTLNIDTSWDYVTTPESKTFVTSTALPLAGFGGGATFGSESLYGGSPDNLYHFRSQPSRQECIAIRYKVWDSVQSGTGESMNLNALVLSVGAKKDLAKVREGRST